MQRLLQHIVTIREILNLSLRQWEQHLRVKQYGAAKFVAMSGGEELLDDFICPICKHPKADFEKAVR